MKIKIGSRKSKLAREQSLIVKKYLLTLPEIQEVEIVTIDTYGDQNQTINWKNSSQSLKGLFTLELEQKLKNQEIDLAVHSLKDMPVTSEPGLVIAQYLGAEDNRDCLLTLDNKELKDLKTNAIIGTSSKRREVNLLALRADLTIKPIRGNINTRIKKLEQGEYDAIVLAVAGIKRLNLTKYVSQIFDQAQFIPASGQGVLAIQTEISHPLVKLLKAKQDEELFIRASLERELATIFDGGCQTPVGSYVKITGDTTYMHAFYEHLGVSYQASAYYQTIKDSPLAYIVSNKIRSQYANPQGVVSLVGAGCGDPELLTIKGQKIIQEADIIFYDRLVNPQLLSHAPQKTVFVNVGKGNNEGGLSQEKINQMLVDASFKYSNIVRLKGGDPFIFGRGYEECEVLEKYKIKYKVIPGISAFQGASSYSNIPLTVRNITNGISIFNSNNDLDYAAMSQLKTTLVFYMSVQKGATVAHNLIANGYDPNASCAYIERATYNDQRIIKFLLKDLAKTVTEFSIKPPAILLISKNLDVCLSYNWFNDERKFKILSTREDKYFTDFKKQFDSTKYEVCNYAQIKIEYSKINLELTNEKIILFNSVNGVKGFLQATTKADLTDKIICAVGVKTCQYLKDNNLQVDYVAKNPTMKSLIAEVESKYQGLKTLVITSNLVKEELENKLAKDQYKVISTYQTKFVEHDYENLKNELLTTNTICFFSASAVNNFMRNIKYNFVLLNSIKIFVLGITTAKELEKYDLHPDVISKKATQEYLIKEVKDYYENI